MYEAGSHCTMHICLKLVQVLQLAASLFVLLLCLGHALLLVAMAMGPCPCCKVWMKILTTKLRTGQRLLTFGRILIATAEIAGGGGLTGNGR